MDDRAPPQERQHTETSLVSNELLIAAAPAHRRNSRPQPRPAAWICSTRADDALRQRSTRTICFNQAAAYQGVNPSVLRAVAWFESKGDAAAVNRNANGSVDVGQLQINSIHFGDLARQGVPHRALTDP